MILSCRKPGLARETASEGHPFFKEPCSLMEGRPVSINMKKPVHHVGELSAVGSPTWYKETERIYLPGIELA